MSALQKELSTAITAVVRASRLTQKIFKSLQSGQKGSAATVTKVDKSPVTIADYGSQAIVNAVLRSVFPADPIVGEEDSNELRANQELRQKVWDLVSSTLQATPAKEIAQGGGEIRSDEEMLDLIDSGNYAGGSKGRFWTLDPIDGTQGFLRGGQYAVCLALVVDGKVKVGVLACPNLPIAFKEPSSERGLLLYGLEGGKAFQTALSRPDPADAELCHMKPINLLADATFCESVESGHSSHHQQSRISEILGIRTQSIRMDSQAKYATLTRGDADIYLRLPVNMEYEEKIWDHASGQLLVELAGGRVSDMYGNPLDFGRGRTLKSKGVIACEKSIHSSVIEAVKQTLSET